MNDRTLIINILIKYDITLFLLDSIIIILMQINRVRNKKLDSVIEDDKRISKYKLTHRRTNANSTFTILSTASINRYFIERTNVA